MRRGRRYPTFAGALICANKAGEHGAARHGLSFSYSYQSAGMGSVKVAHAIKVDEEACAPFVVSVRQGFRTLGNRETVY